MDWRPSPLYSSSSKHCITNLNFLRSKSTVLTTISSTLSLNCLHLVAYNIAVKIRNRIRGVIMVTVQYSGWADSDSKNGWLQFLCRVTLRQICMGWTAFWSRKCWLTGKPNKQTVSWDCYLIIQIIMIILMAFRFDPTQMAEWELFRKDTIGNSGISTAVRDRVSKTL